MNWDQLRALLWVKWRILRNQWRRGGELSAIITTIAVVLGLCVGVLGAIAGLWGGAYPMSNASPVVIMVAWEVLVLIFCVLWLVGIVNEVQRSESIDFTRLLHLPVSLRDVFLLNYVASHMSFTLALVIPLSLGLAVGLVIGRGWSMLPLVPLVIGFFFMVTAWTYCLRGWLASIMVNQRRRRTVIMIMTLACVLIGQMPYLVSHVLPRYQRTHVAHSKQSESEKWERVLAAAEPFHKAVPILWLPYGARTLAQGHIGTSLLLVLGTFGLGALGLKRAYCGTIRFYQADVKVKPKQKTSETGSQTANASASGRSSGMLLLERELRWIPREAAAMALATFRSATRAPEFKMTLVFPFVMFFIIAASSMGGSQTGLTKLRPFVGGFSVAITIFGMSPVLLNLFGFDRDGFRALVLSPAARHNILLGKNLSLLPIAFGIFLLFLIAGGIFAKSGIILLFAGLLQFAAAFCIFSMAGNLLSILMPYRIASGTLKPTKTKALTTFLIMLTHSFVPILLLPVILPGVLGWLFQKYDWFSAEPVTLLFSVLVASGAGALYWFTLKPLGNLLQSRETRILQVVTQEVE